MPLENYLRQVGGATFACSYKALKIYSKSRGFDPTKPCSMHDDGRCWIFNHLRQMNFFLFHASMELKETTPCRLSLCDLEVDNVVDKPLIAVGCILTHILLRNHECIASASLSTLIMSSTSDQPLLGDALQHNKGLRSIKVVDNRFGRQEKFLKALCGMNNIESLSLMCAYSKPTSSGQRLYHRPFEVSLAPEGLLRMEPSATFFRVSTLRKRVTICLGPSPDCRGLRETSPDESGTVTYLSRPAATSLNASVMSKGRVCVRVGSCAQERKRGMA
ncbi:hypothetical protein HPB47_015136 [Ixodes persulcatus]|uniref:Uncharacterized protein n=1 Tax=Ixodes persulcatus TaxID=34615 RepID=A0AC60QUA5_IXOPE|nr:hypothetical protein HPB47_015136 [Ixodes persulcatus]